MPLKFSPLMACSAGEAETRFQTFVCGQAKAVAAAAKMAIHQTDETDVSQSARQAVEFCRAAVICHGAGLESASRSAGRGSWRFV